MQGNQVLSKEALVDRLWSDPPASARNLVEKYVSLWRKALGPDRLETVGRGYRLHLAPDELDLAVHRQRLAEGRALAAAGDHGGAAAVLREAFGMWRGWDVRTSAQELLPETEAQVLVDVFLRGLEDWVESALSSGDDHDVTPPLRAALEQNPYRERLAELLMWAYSRQGDHDKAAEVYRLTRRRLKQDLGQEPGDALQRMHGRVLRLDPALRQALPGQRVTNLSLRRQRFTGREDALARLQAALRPDDGGGDGLGVAISGGVGVGKTALALEFARRHVEDYDLVWVVNAPTRNAIADGLEALAARLGCPLPAERNAGLQRVWNRLSHKRRWLLIFDNAGSPLDLQDYWPDSQTGTLIITSLNPDWGRYLAILELHELSLSETVALLGARGMSGPEEHLQLLARELGGLPLACEQAAAYIRQTGMDITQYLSLFRAHRDQLLQRGVPEDHDGTIQASWRLARARLSASPAAVHLAQLCASLAPEDIPLDMLAANRNVLPEELSRVVGDELGLEDTIGELRQYSLVSRTPTRLRMHRLVQAVIVASLTGQEARDWRRRARRLLVAAAPTATSPSASWPLWQDLVPHVVFLAGSADPGPGIEADFVDLLHRTGEYLVARGSFDDARALLERTMELAQVKAGDRATAPAQLEQARTWMELGDVLCKGGNPQDAVMAYERALTVFRRYHPDDHPWVARSVAGLTTAMSCHQGVSLWQAQELPRAQRSFEAALAVLRHALGPEDPVVAHAVSGLGNVLQDRGDVDGAVACQEEARDALKAAYGPDHPDVGHVYGKLGFALGLRHDFDRAKACHEESLRILTAAFGSGQVETGWPLSNLGVLYLDAGDVEQAIALQTRAEQIFEAAPGDGVATRIARWRLARALLSSGRTDQAVRLLAEALPFLTRRLGAGHPDVLGVAADLEQASMAARSPSLEQVSVLTGRNAVTCAAVARGFRQMARAGRTRLRQWSSATWRIQGVPVRRALPVTLSIIVTATGILASITSTASAATAQGVTVTGHDQYLKPGCAHVPTMTYTVPAAGQAWELSAEVTGPGSPGSDSKSSSSSDPASGTMSAYHCGSDGPGVYRVDARYDDTGTDQHTTLTTSYTVSKAPARVSMTPSRASVRTGQNITFSGATSYLDGSGYRAMKAGSRSSGAGPGRRRGTTGRPSGPTSRARTARRSRIRSRTASSCAPRSPAIGSPPPTPGRAGWHARRTPPATPTAAR